MAVTSEQLGILQGMLAGLTDQQKQILGGASTPDISAAAAQLITQQRGQSMGQVVSALVTGSVSDWSALEDAVAVSDGATIYDAIAAFNSALAAHNASGAVATAVRVALAAKKHLGV